MNPVSWVNLVAQESASAESTITLMSVLGETKGMVLVVLILLAAASVCSWFLIFYKALRFAQISRASRAFIDAFWDTNRFDEVDDAATQHGAAPSAQAFRAGYLELRRVVDADGKARGASLGSVERALRRAANASLQEQERYLTFLATVGSSAPFVGLFGTVWGIMMAFMRISAEGAAGIDVVAGPIAEALIATAVGLMAAIPAVMGYNFFNARIEQMRTDVDGFVSDAMNVIERSFLP